MIWNNELKIMTLNILTLDVALFSFVLFFFFFLQFSLCLWRLYSHFLLLVNTYLNFLKIQTYDHAVLNITFKTNTIDAYTST